MENLHDDLLPAQNGFLPIYGVNRSGYLIKRDGNRVLQHDHPVNPMAFTQGDYLYEDRSLAILLTKEDVTPKLSSNFTLSDLSAWHSTVISYLMPLNLQILVDWTTPKPITLSRPLASTWIFWSITVRDWIYNQLDNDLMEVIDKLPDRPTYADDLWEKIHKINPEFSTWSEDQLWNDFWAMKCSDFASPGNYIRAWIQICEVYAVWDHGITPHKALKSLLRRLEEYLPPSIPKVRLNISRGELNAFLILLLTELEGIPEYVEDVDSFPWNKTTREIENGPKKPPRRNPKRKASEKRIRKTLPKENDLARLAREWHFKSVEEKKKARGFSSTERTETSPPQTSRFLAIPGEIRNEIYKYLFASTRLTFGERAGDNEKVESVKPAPNSLAILRTCHQIKREAETLWLGLVLFNFQSTCSMLDKLSALPSAILSEIRNVRVVGGPLRLHRFGYSTEARIDCYFEKAMKFLPGLRLDRLTILGSSRSQTASTMLHWVIQYVTGWKELYFVTPDSEMMEHDVLQSCWKALFERRGDKGSYKVYRSTELDSPGSVLNPNTRQLLEQGPGHPVNIAKSKTSPRAEGLVIVKLSNEVDLTSPGPESVSHWPLLWSPGGYWANGLTWAEIRRQCGDIKLYQEFTWNNLRENLNVAVDQYDDVEECSWNGQGWTPSPPWNQFPQVGIH